MSRALIATFVVGALAQQASAQPAPSSDDDLSRAADVVADVATVPAPGDAPAAPAAPSDPVDLSALGLDAEGNSFDDKLAIYGFADFLYGVEHFGKAIPIAGYAQDGRSFGVGNLNVYLAKNLTLKARSLIELRFTFLPNGSVNADGSVVDTTAYDVGNFYRPVQWGGVVVERAQIDYDLTPNLTLRAGHWLTPYGIWNIDHGSPVIIPIIRPFIIGEQFFPEHQTGLDLFGSYYREGFGVTYHLTASNGRGATEAQADQDSKLAFGGRLELDTPWNVKVGGSYYRGRYTGVATKAGAVPETYLEAAYGGDVQLLRGPLLLQGEVILRERHYPSGRRTTSPYFATAFTPDGRDFGYYALAAYRFDQLWNVMPFAYVEDYWPADISYATELRSFSMGLNFRPSPNLVLKVEAAYTTYPPGGIGIVDGSNLFTAAAQAAWVF